MSPEDALNRGNNGRSKKPKLRIWFQAGVSLVLLFFFVFLCLIISLLFIPAARNGKDLTITSFGSDSTSSPPFAAGSPQFVQTLASLTDTAVGRGEDIRVINTGDQFLGILLDEINAASSSIDFTDYVWSNGTFSNEVAAALTAAAHRGVSVRLLLDAVGGHTIPQSLMHALQIAGVKVEKYHTFSPLHPFQYDDRDHVRSIVIDGKTGFFGGMGIGDDWIHNPPGTSDMPEWKDIMFEVKGHMVLGLQSAFQELWNETTGEVLTGSAFYPTFSPLLSPDSLSIISHPSTSTPAWLASTTASFVSVMSIPSGNLEPIRDAFLLTIASAKKSLYIVSPFIIPDRGVLDAIEARAKAGVDVRIVSPGDSTYAPFLRDAWQADYGELLKAGVKLYEYEPSMIHEKYIIVDGVWSVIGSANMDSRSESLNAENIMGISDPAFAADLGSDFAGDMAVSKEITVGDWSGRSVFAKMLSGFLLLFSKQL